MSKFTVKVEKCCRICLITDNEFETTNSITLLPLNTTDTQMTFAEKLSYCVAEVVQNDEGIPKFICSNCIQDLQMAYNFRLRCLMSYRIMKKNMYAIGDDSGGSGSGGGSGSDANTSKSNSTEMCPSNQQQSSATLVANGNGITPPSPPLATTCHPSAPIAAPPTATKRTPVDGNTADTIAAVKTEGNDGQSTPDYFYEDLNEGDVEAETTAAATTDSVPADDVKKELRECNGMDYDFDDQEMEEDVTTNVRDLTSNGTTTTPTRMKTPIKIQDEQISTTNSTLKSHCRPRADSSRQHVQTVRIRNDLSAPPARHKTATAHAVVDAFQWKRSSKCKLCAKTFRNQYYWRIHQYAHRDVIKPFECVLCNQRFASERQLKVHVHLHTDDKPYACWICDYHAEKPSTLRNHMRAHTECSQCKRCARRFHAIYSYARHRCAPRPRRPPAANHNKSAGAATVRTKPFECTICGRCFIAHSFLRLHMMEHSDRFNTEWNDVK